MPPDDLQTDIEGAREQVERAQVEQVQRAPKIDQPISLSTVRFRVTRWVLAFSAACVILVGSFVVFGNDSDKTKTLVGILTTLLLPIVTLVMGFYFGSKSE